MNRLWNYNEPQSDASGPLEHFRTNYHSDGILWHGCCSTTSETMWDRCSALSRCLLRPSPCTQGRDAERNPRKCHEVANGGWTYCILFCHFKGDWEMCRGVSSLIRNFWNSLPGFNLPLEQHWNWTRIPRPRDKFATRRLHHSSKYICLESIDKEWAAVPVKATRKLTNERKTTKQYERTHASDYNIVHFLSLSYFYHFLISDAYNMLGRLDWGVVGTAELYLCGSLWVLPSARFATPRIHSPVAKPWKPYAKYL